VLSCLVIKRPVKSKQKLLASRVTEGLTWERGIMVFWDMTSCSLVNSYKGFGRKFLARISGFLLLYAAMEKASPRMLGDITL